MRVGFRAALAVGAGVLVGVGLSSAQEASRPARQNAPHITIEYIAHASFIIESPGGTRLLLDPYADRVWLGYDFPEEWTADAVAITHPHYDHDGGEFRELDVPWSAGQTVFRDPGSFSVGDIRLLGVRGKHVDPYGKEFGQRNTIWVMEMGDVRIAHLGDNGPLTPEMIEAMGRVDILMMAADGEEHIMTYPQIDEVLDQLSPRVVLPMHYRIADLEPGEGPSDLGELDPWIDGRERVLRMDGNVWTTSDLPTLAPGTVIVLQHSPEVSRPGA